MPDGPSSTPYAKTSTFGPTTPSRPFANHLDCDQFRCKPSLGEPSMHTLIISLNDFDADSLSCLAHSLKKQASSGHLFAVDKRPLCQCGRLAIRCWIWECLSHNESCRGRGGSAIHLRIIYIQRSVCFLQSRNVAGKFLVSVVVGGIKVKCQY